MGRGEKRQQALAPLGETLDGKLEFDVAYLIAPLGGSAWSQHAIRHGGCFCV